VTVKQDREQQQEWLRQNSLGFGALIAVGVVVVQPFLTAASLDASARICVAAFSVAIPLLAALTLLNRQEAFRRRRAKSVVVAVTQVAAQLSAFVGVVAGFWHILWIAGVGILAAGLVGVAVHSAGYARLERDQEAAP
jgi:cobalamin synthase